MSGLSAQSNFIVVIRTAGERTLAACKRLALEQVPESRLHIVNEHPFEAALRRCYEIGLESGVEWMITLDADVLLRKGAISGLLKEAEALPGSHFQVEGMVLDKLTRRFRWAGYRAYRVKHLKAAWDLLPGDRAEIRPESSTLERMATLGYPYLRSRKIYGIHDYEQSLSDIYRKAFVHANKHPQWLPELLGTWKELAKEDADFRVALCGAFDGLLASEAPRIDTRDFAEQASSSLIKLGMAEKGVLDCEAVTFNAIDELINSGLKSPEITEVVLNATHPSWLAARFSELGPVRIAPYITGALICRIGNLIKRMAQIKMKYK